MKVIFDGKVPVKLWADEIEEGAMEQFNNLANLPFAYKWIVGLPDAHKGFGVPIGSVLCTLGVVVVNAIGVDISCGLIAQKINFKSSDLPVDVLKDIMSETRKAIPVGFKYNMEVNEREIDDYMPDPDEFGVDFIVGREYEKAVKQLGSLGSGNHFIEFQRDEDDNLWIMIHSGSRNLGKKVADHYNKIARDLNEKYFSSVPSEWQLAFLPLNSQEGKNYLLEMNYCIRYAYYNRFVMLMRIINILKEKGIEVDDSPINIAHNYARFENHYGKNVLVHRKGATLVRKDTIGIIPGSQGTCSYIVKGKGNPESFNSCSHGAGRVMSRAKARNELDLEEEKKRLDDKGIIHAIRNESDLDEASSAYKNIDEVMENQKDLVEIIHKLEPLAVIKG